MEKSFLKKFSAILNEILVFVAIGTMRPMERVRAEVASAKHIAAS